MESSESAVFPRNWSAVESKSFWCTCITYMYVGVLMCDSRPMQSPSDQQEDQNLAWNTWYAWLLLRAQPLQHRSDTWVCKRMHTREYASVCIHTHTHILTYIIWECDICEFPELHIPNQCIYVWAFLPSLSLSYRGFLDLDVEHVSFELNFHADLVLFMLLAVHLESSLKKERWSQGRDRSSQVLYTEHCGWAPLSIRTLRLTHRQTSCILEIKRALSLEIDANLAAFSLLHRLSAFISAFFLCIWMLVHLCIWSNTRTETQDAMGQGALTETHTRWCLKQIETIQNVLFTEAICIGVKSVGWRCVPIFRLDTAGTLERAPSSKVGSFEWMKRSKTLGGFCRALLNCCISDNIKSTSSEIALPAIIIVFAACPNSANPNTHKCIRPSLSVPTSQRLKEEFEEKSWKMYIDSKKLKNPPGSVMLTNHRLIQFCIEPTLATRGPALRGKDTALRGMILVQVKERRVL